MAEEEFTSNIDDAELFKATMASEPATEAPADPPEQDEPPAEAATPEPEPQPVEPVADPPVEAVEPTQEEAEPVKGEGHVIPLPEHLALRDRAQKAELERDSIQREYERRVAELERTIAQATQPKPEPIDPIENPEAYHQQREAQFSEQLDQMRLSTSEMIVRQSMGSEKVDAAIEWVRGNPAQAQQFMKSANPYGDLVQAYERDQTLQTVGGDLDAYTKRIKEEAINEAMNDPAHLAKAVEAVKAKAGASPSPTNVKLPPSLNNAQSAGSAKSDAGDPTTLPMSDPELLTAALRR